jgi:hypothetical protein
VRRSAASLWLAWELLVPRSESCNVPYCLSYKPFRRPSVINICCIAASLSSVNGVLSHLQVSLACVISGSTSKYCTCAVECKTTNGTWGMTAAIKHLLINQKDSQEHLILSTAAKTVSSSQNLCLSSRKLGNDMSTHRSYLSRGFFGHNTHFNSFQSM